MEYTSLKKEAVSLITDNESRGREAWTSCALRLRRLKTRQLKGREEECLAACCRKYGNARRIMENLSAAYRAVDTEAVGNALHQVCEVAEFDPELKAIQDQLYDAEAVLSDAHQCALENISEQLDFDEQSCIRKLRTAGSDPRPGASTAQVWNRSRKALEEKKNRLEQLEHFDEYRMQLEQQYQKAEKSTGRQAQELSAVRQEEAKSWRRRSGQVPRSI
ncbi:MAG: hypothetical protein ACLUD2_04210 [Clostridium sp.]